MVSYSYYIERGAARGRQRQSNYLSWGEQSEKAKGQETAEHKEEYQKELETEKTPSADESREHF